MVQEAEFEAPKLVHDKQTKRASRKRKLDPKSLSFVSMQQPPEAAVNLRRVANDCSPAILATSHVPPPTMLLSTPFC